MTRLVTPAQAGAHEHGRCPIRAGVVFLDTGFRRYDDKRIGTKRIGLAAVLSLGFALLLAGCGFRPLYGDVGAADAARPDPSAQMAQVRIAPLSDRIGQQMHNLLRDRLNPAGQPRDPRYRLRVRLHESTESLAIRRDETATRANLTITADFALEDLASREVVLEGQATSINSYNILTSQFATYNAERDARERSLRELSDDIRTRLGLYFSQARAAAP